MTLFDVLNLEHIIMLNIIIVIHIFNIFSGVKHSLLELFCKAQAHHVCTCRIWNKCASRRKRKVCN